MRCGSETRVPGFSLIEVIVAVAILSIAMVGLAHGISTALGSSKEAELQTTAAMYAAGLIENLRAEGKLIDGQTEGDCGAELPLYRWTESITAASVGGLHQVDISILNSHSGQEIYALRTMLFEVPADSTKKPWIRNQKRNRARRHESETDISNASRFHAHRSRDRRGAHVGHPRERVYVFRCRHSRKK